MKRNIDVLAKESKVATQKRKELAEKWAVRVEFTDEELAIIKEEGASVNSCRAVLVGYTLTSHTGDFSTAKQSTVAKKISLSLRTVNKCIKALRRMGKLFAKHNYKTDEQGRKKRVASYTILCAFRNQFDRMKSYLNSYKGIAPAEVIVQKITNFSVCAADASLFKSFNKVIKSFGFLDHRSGEIFDAEAGIKQIQRETYLAMRGV